MTSILALYTDYDLVFPIPGHDNSAVFLGMAVSWSNMVATAVDSVVGAANYKL